MPSHEQAFWASCPSRLAVLSPSLDRLPALTERIELVIQLTTCHGLLPASSTSFVTFKSKLPGADSRPSASAQPSPTCGLPPCFASQHTPNY